MTDPNNLYERFKRLHLKTSLVDFEVYEAERDGNSIIARNKNVYFGTISGNGEMIFCFDKNSKNGHKVYPVANSFQDFLALILSTGSAQAIQNLSVWKKDEYIRYLRNVKIIDYLNTDEVMNVLFTIRFVLKIDDMNRPYEYVNYLVKTFDYDSLTYKNNPKNLF